MNINEFAKKVQTAAAGSLGEEYNVTLKEVRKNNNVRLQGLIIRRQEQNISPTIYLDAFFEAYMAGMEFDNIVRRVIEMFREEEPGVDIDMDFFRSFDKVRDRICYRLIHAGKNQELLEKVPYIPFLDLAVCFFYSYENAQLGNGVIMIYNNHLDMWNTTTEELARLSAENTPRIYPWDMNSMESVIQELFDEEREDFSREEQNLFLAEMPLQILSNKGHHYGASSILYPGLLKQLANEIGSSLYILPSSVHEVIILPDRHGEDEQQLKQMIADVNATQLEPEEVLSDSLYYFDLQEGIVKAI